MPTSIPNPISSHTPDSSDRPDKPPRHADNTPFHPNSEPPPRQNRTESAESRRAGLAQAVDGAEDGGVRGRVVEEDDGGGEGEGAGCDLEEEDERDSQPDGGAGSWIGGAGGRGQEGDVGR